MAKTLQDLKKEMLEEVEIMTDPHRILDEYNSMFGEHLEPEDIENWSKDEIDLE